MGAPLQYMAIISDISRLHEDIERIKREKGEDFEYERTDSDSEERWRR